MKTYEPTDLGGVMKKNGSTILANLGIFVAMCTVLVAMTLFFTEVSFSVGSVVEMSFSFLLLFLHIITFLRFCSFYTTSTFFLIYIIIAI